MVSSVFKKQLKMKLIVLSILTLSSSSYATRDEWMKEVLGGEYPKAIAIAKAKEGKYGVIGNELYRQKLNEVTQIYDYAQTHVLPKNENLNIYLLKRGLLTFQQEQSHFWETINTSDPRTNYSKALELSAIHALYEFGPQDNAEWTKVFADAEQKYPSLYVEHEALKVLKAILEAARTSISSMPPCPEDIPPSYLNELSLHTRAMTHVMGFLTDMSPEINAMIRDFQNLQKFWIKKQKDLLEIDDSSFVSNPSCTLAVVDADYRESDKTLGGLTVTGIFDLPSKKTWKDDTPLNLVNSWPHGNFMFTITQNFVTSSPHAYYYPGLSDKFCPFTIMKGWYKTPVVYSLSIHPRCLYPFLKKDDSGQIIFNSSSQEEIKAPGNIAYWKNLLQDRYPTKSVDGPLDEEQLGYLKSEEEKNRASREASERLAEVVDHEANRQQIAVVAPLNEPGPLQRNPDAFSSGRIKFLDDPRAYEHAIVALNYNILEERLESCSAGEFQDIALVVPAARMAVVEEGNPLPYIRAGGNSAATAMTSALVNRVQMKYPDLTYNEVKQALFEGANKTFTGYDPSLHGHGMLNLRGALEVAAKLDQSRRTGAASSSEAL